MSVAVNLLLLLSALLSALTGAGTRMPTPQQSVAVAQVATHAAVASVAPAARAGVPVASLPVLATVALVPHRPEWRLPAPVPLFASRRRE